MAKQKAAKPKQASASKGKGRKTKPATSPLTKAEQMTLRRWRMVTLVVQGFPVPDAIRKVAAEFKIKPNTVKQDWKGRTAWMPEMMDTAHRDMDVMAREALLRIQVISHELTEVKQSAMSALKTYKTRRTEKVPMFDQDGRLKGHKEVTAEEIQTFPGADHNSAVRALAERRQLEEFRLRIGTLFYDRDKGSGLEDLQEDERARLLHQAAQLFGSVPLDVADPYSVAGQVEGIAQAQDIGDGLGSTKAERRENLAALLEEPEQEGDAE